MQAASAKSGGMRVEWWSISRRWRTLPWILSAALLGGVLGVPLDARAELDGCEGLGEAVTEHTCFHARYGPFEDVTATVGTTPTAGTPNVDAVHTYYRVGLAAGEPGVVTHRPQRSGAWAVYLQYAIPLSFSDPSAGPLTSLLREDVPGCPFLDDVRVFELEADVRYSLILGPSTASEVALVLEKVDDFLAFHGWDGDGDGYGDPEDTLVTACASPEGRVPDDRDCDDTDPTIHPGAPELCDGVDRNCNGIVDDVGAPCRAGQGVCVVWGTASCVQVGAAPVCDAEPLDAAGPEECNGLDDDCDGIVDNGGDALCDDPVRPACVSSGTAFHCGCERDADCGGPDSARLCFLRADDQRCIDGCVDLPGRNGCPDGFECTSRDPARPGTCVPEHFSDAGPVADAGADAGVGGPDGDGDGCGCTAVGGRPGTAPAGGLLLGLIVLVLGWRRRRRALSMAPLLMLSVLSGCHEAHHAWAPRPDGGADGSAACVHVMADAPVDHMCIHMRLGPFRSVVAAADGAVPPDVSSSHITWMVLLGFGHRVTYRPSRAGDHVFLTAPGMDVSVLSEAGPVQVRPVVRPDCDVVEHAVTATLQEGERYELHLEAPGVSEPDLFIEHMDAFVEDAWHVACPS
jgi:MYXO-CTERM domain-containing protein